MQIAALVVISGAGPVTLDAGGTKIFARDNGTVNRSQALAFGGDEMIWSTLGDNDAGRGAKTAQVPSAREVTTDDGADTEINERSRYERQEHSAS